MLPHMRQITFYQTTRRRPLAWGSAYQTLRRTGFFLPDYAAAEAHPGEVRASNLGRRLGENGLLPPSITLTTRLHGGGEATLLPLSLRTLTTYREREGYGGTSTRLYGAWRAHTTKLYGDFLLSLSNPDDDDDDGCCCCFFNIIITHLLHSHIHCDLNHSCSKLTLHDLHFFINPRKLHFPLPREIFPSSYTSTQLATLLLFKSPAFFFKPTAIFQTYRGRGGRSRDRGSGGGNFIPEKIFTSPHLHRSSYYSRVQCAASQHLGKSKPQV